MRATVVLLIVGILLPVGGTGFRCYKCESASRQCVNPTREDFKNMRTCTTEKSCVKLVNRDTVSRDCYHDCQEVDGGDGYSLDCCSGDLCNSCSAPSLSLILILGLALMLVSLNVSTIL